MVVGKGAHPYGEYSCADAQVIQSVVGKCPLSYSCYVVPYNEDAQVVVRKCTFAYCDDSVRNGNRSQTAADKGVFAHGNDGDAANGFGDDKFSGSSFRSDNGKTSCAFFNNNP